MRLRLNLHLPLLQLTNAQTALLTLWTLVMISLPVVDWTFSWEVLVGAINLGVLAQFVVVLVFLWETWGAVQTLKIGLALAALAWGIEFLGSRTGFPFGSYTYTDVLQPQLLHVPLLIPLAWLMMLPPSWAVGQALSWRMPVFWRHTAGIIFSALAMTVWDLFLDPQMVNWGLWVWERPCCYFGIPWSNYLGWFLASGLITALLRPKNLPMAPLLLVYTITWLLESVGLGIFWAQPGPALSGFFLMGIMSIFGWRVYLLEKSSEK